MRKFCLLPLPYLCGTPTYAPSPVWSGSVREPVAWQRLPKKAAVKLWHRARDFERRTREPGRQDGALGRNGLAVLHTLIFDFLNFATGRLDPAQSTIAKKAGISPRSVARGLVALKAAGVLNWLRRCAVSMEDGRFTLRQESNAYAILPPSQWHGYTPPAEPPAPDSAAWGATPPLPDALTAAALGRQQGGSVGSALRELENDETNPLAAILARLGRAIERKESQQFTGLPA